MSERRSEGFISLTRHPAHTLPQELCVSVIGSVVFSLLAWFRFLTKREHTRRVVRAYPIPNNLPINPQPLIPAKAIRIAADTIAPNNMGHRVR